MESKRKIKKILIATGIYPPDIGGPAQYAFELEKVWKNQDFDVNVKCFSFERKLPTGVRHFFYFLKSLPAIVKADYILVLDTWSAALPIAIGCMILGKKFTIRTGGDFLWESYVERTKQKILFKDFYKAERSFTIKERVTFKITKWILGRADKVVFSTDWQRHIWIKPYNLDAAKTEIVENYYGEVISSESKEKIFLGATRNLIWKNLDILQDVFKNIDAKLDISTSSHDAFIDRIKDSYAVILVSFGDISPNMILDAIALGKPFILTRETGIYDRVRDIAIFVDPLDLEDIRSKVLWLCDNNNYSIQRQKVESFAFRHTWEQIAGELLTQKI